MRIKQNLNKMISFAFYYTGALVFLNCFYKKFVNKGSITILMYHRVGKNKNSGYHMAVSPENFGKQVRHLVKNNKIISLEEICTCLRSKKLPKEDCVAITMDDGYHDNYVNAYPVLKRYNIPATIFLVPGYIGTNQILWWERAARIINIIKEQKIDLKLQEDIYSGDIKNIIIRICDKKIKRVQEVIDLLCVFLKSVSEKDKNTILSGLESKVMPYLNGSYNQRDILTWDEIIEMDKNGINFGGHTITHPILTKIGIEQAKNEILNSKKEIENRINGKVLHFSYPNGKEGDFNEEIKKIVKDSGYISSCSAIEGVNDPQADLFALKRKGVDNSPFYVFAFRNSPFINFIKSKMGK